MVAGAGSAGIFLGWRVAGWSWVVGLVVGLCLFVAGCFHLWAFCGLCFGGVDSYPQPAQNANTGRLCGFYGYCAGGVAGWLVVALCFVRCELPRVPVLPLVGPTLFEVTS